MNRDKILDILSYAIILIGVILFVIFKDNFILSLFIVGVTGMVFGLYSIYKNESYAVQVLSISFMLTLTTVLYHYHWIKSDNAITFAIVGSFVCLMLVSLLLSIVRRAKAMRIHSVKVFGSVIDLKKNPNTRKEIYNAIYGYEVDGKSYNVMCPFVFEKNIPSIGDSLNFYVSPDDPMDVWFDQNKIILIKDYILHVVFAIVGIVILVIMFL